MPNDWFQFKQFKVEQDLCAMKVSTDACIQGAWAARWLSAKADMACERALDIGTGTGLLTLMMAQQNPCTIDAIELNEDAFVQAKGNFTSSPWSQRLLACHNSLDEFTDKSIRSSYDFIICNPPFFHNHLQAQQKARNDARHSISLSKEELAQAVSLLLTEQGTFCVMYPQTEWGDWLNISHGQGLHPMSTLMVKPKGNSEANRMIGLFSKKNNQVPQTETLVIYEEDKSYTTPFTQLLQPYYLAL